MAWSDYHTHLQALSRFGQNAEGAHERVEKRSAVDEGKPGTANPPPWTIEKHYNIFFVVYKLLDTVQIDQTGAFPITLQLDCRYIMVGIHLNANYIFCKLMKNQTKGEMITAY
jgi:hypothetical protein